MEITTLIIGIIIGVVLGALLLYFILKSGNVPRKDFDELNQNYIKVNSDLQNSNLRISELNDSAQKEKDINFQQTEILNQLKTEIAKISAENGFPNCAHAAETGSCLLNFSLIVGSKNFIPIIPPIYNT